MCLFKGLLEKDNLSMPRSLLCAPAQGRHLFTMLHIIVFICAVILVLAMRFGSLVTSIID